MISLITRFGLAISGCVMATFSFGQVTLTEVTRYNLTAIRTATTSSGSANPFYIGNNTSAVAWNGFRLFVAGLNNAASASNTGIIEILNTATAGIVNSTAVQYGNRFGNLPNTNPFNGRGYSGLAISGNRLFASWDNDPDSFQQALAGYDISSIQTTGPLWVQPGRGGAGVAMDPGYVVGGVSQGGAGVGWTSFGGVMPAGTADRRALNDPATGSFTYGFDSSGTAAVPAGFVWRPDASAGVPRDITFDPDTGDLYGRTNGEVTVAVRTGANSADPRNVLWSASTGNAVGQNIAFMSNTVAGDLLAFNIRENPSASRSFIQAVQLMDTAGAVKSVTWNFLDGAAYGNQMVQGPIYDFAFDPASQTLAVVGAQGALQLSIFQVVPEPSTLSSVTAGLALGIWHVARRRP